MTKTMLIDAVHQEETRVVVVTNSNQVEEFDFESKAKTQLRGNIYLAKVTRIEPSLQAAFVDYGGNRHGFLAFNEIHPDYYQIPIADKELLLEAEAAANEALAQEEKAIDGDVDSSSDDDDDGEEIELEAADEDPNDDEDDSDDVANAALDGSPSSFIAQPVSDAEVLDLEADESADDAVEDDEIEEAADAPEIEAAPVDTDRADDPEDEDPMIELRRLRRQKLRSYKIQEVIKRRQVLLVQVVKEERGNKGAALTTYLSLAGRYCVLMPNTGRGGGISRKITNGTDRKRLRKIVDAMEVPDGMGLIIRTAGSKRTKTEIKRDYEYLLRIWENVRTLTLESIAPTLVYEEGSLVKRAIRDLYTKDIDEILVEGDDSYKEAKGFMRLLMPSHAKNVKQYKEASSIFHKFQVENQLDATLSPEVPLPSGGYLVINPTEALVSVDVNSGKSTRERNVENTALRTNLEAATEVARQCRLRDLAGLIVIDFIDMEESRNNRTVEKRLRDALKQDRARTQVGRLSSFGLLEMSRQRMRSGVLEGSSQTCPTCHGSGLVRSESSTALRILRAIEEVAQQGADEDEINIRACEKVALYLLNEKRAEIRDVEIRCGIRATVTIDEEFSQSIFAVTRGNQQVTSESFQEIAPAKHSHVPQSRADDAQEDDEMDGTNGKGRKRRRRRGGKKSGRQSDENGAAEKSANAEETSEDDGKDNQSGNGKRRRGRRGGRRRRGGDQQQANAQTENSEAGETSADPESTEETQPANETSFDTVATESDDVLNSNHTDSDYTAPNGDNGEAFSDLQAEETFDNSADGISDQETYSSWKSEPSSSHLESESADTFEAHADSNEGDEDDDDLHQDESPQSSEVVAHKSEPSRKGWWQKRFF